MQKQYSIITEKLLLVESFSVIIEYGERHGWTCLNTTERMNAKISANYVFNLTSDWRRDLEKKRPIS